MEQKIELTKIIPNVNNPRKVFDKEKLEELTQSINKRSPNDDLDMVIDAIENTAKNGEKFMIFCRCKVISTITIAVFINKRKGL